MLIKTPSPRISVTRLRAVIPASRTDPSLARYAVPNAFPDIADIFTEGGQAATKEGQDHARLQSEEEKGREAVPFYGPARGWSLFGTMARRSLTMPQEIRDEIYELALTEPDGITVTTRKSNHRHIVERGHIVVSEGNNYSGKQQPRYRGYRHTRIRAGASFTYFGTRRQASLSPSLCAVSKQMREEASSVLYKQEIILADTTALHVFITTIGPFNWRLLSHLTIKGWGVLKSNSSHNFAAFAAMAGCVNLKSLFLDCSITTYPNTPAHQLAEQIYTNAHFFLEAYGTANGRYDAALDVLEMSMFHFKEKEGPDEAQHPSGSEFGDKKYKAFNAALRSFILR